MGHAVTFCTSQEGKGNQCLNVIKMPLGKAAADFRDVENLRVEMDKIY